MTLIPDEVLLADERPVAELDRVYLADTLRRMAWLLTGKRGRTRAEALAIIADAQARSLQHLAAARKSDAWSVLEDDAEDAEVSVAELDALAEHRRSSRVWIW